MILVGTENRHVREDPVKTINRVFSVTRHNQEVLPDASIFLSYANAKFPKFPCVDTSPGRSLYTEVQEHPFLKALKAKGFFCIKKLY